MPNHYAIKCKKDLFRLKRMPARERGKGPWGPSENGNALHERNGLSSHGLHRSTFGDGELNCRVRHGTG